jgi:SAM-dependent methyltransferase
MSTPADNGWSQSAGPWLRLMDQGDPNRVYLLDEVMLGLCGEVRGLDVLDVGCGEGRFCRMLATRGARTIGVDPTVELIDAARLRQPGGVYHAAGGEALPLPEASVDLVVSYVSLVDIPDYRAAVREMARVLRPGGRCVVANLNSFATATTQYWARDEEGHKLHWTMDNYMVPRPARAEWAGMSIVNWHRPLSAYLQAFLGAGFTLEHFDEPMPKPPAIAAHPSMQDFHRIPHFCTMVWRATGAASGTPL